MKQRTILLVLFFAVSFTTYSQSDTLLADKYFKTADSLRKAAQFDSSNYYYQKASDIYLKLSQLSELSDSNVLINESFSDSEKSSPHSSVPPPAGGGLKRGLWQKYIDCQNWIGWNLAIYIGELSKAIEHINNTLTTGIIKLGEKHLSVGATY